MAEREPIRLGEVEGGPSVRRKNVQKRKRGPAKKALTKKEMELRLMSDRMKDLVEGRISIDDLDDEEVLRGELRDKNGNFTGQKSALVPRQFHDAVRRRIIQDTDMLLRKDYQAVVANLVRIATDPRVAAREQLAAAQYVMERVIGKIPEKMEIKTETTIFQQQLETGGFLVDLDDDSIIDAEEVHDE